MVVGVERKANKVRVLDNRLEILANIYACSLPKKIYSPSLTISHKNHQAPVTHSINTSFHGLGVKPREDIPLIRIVHPRMERLAECHIRKVPRGQRFSINILFI